MLYPWCARLNACVGWCAWTFRFSFCLAFKGEARHMYCFSGVVRVVVVNFFKFLY